MPTPPRVAILLSTYNGARFLTAQLDSLLAQTVADWMLYWRDDGSTDGTVALMEAFAARERRCVFVGEASGHLGVNGSFIALLRRAMADRAAAVAFADQDDVWLPEKLARGLAGLGDDPVPCLYCSRQVLVDEALNRLSDSAPLRREPGFAAALTQNIATGCTVLLNQAAVSLVASSTPPAATLHDWWSYLVVTAAGGRVVVDPVPAVLYRQHGRNLVGAPATMRRRAVAAMSRGPEVFLNVLRGHVGALRSQPALLSPESRAVLDLVDAGLRGGVRERLRALRLHGLHRQTWQETLLFRWWFLIAAPRSSRTP